MDPPHLSNLFPFFFKKFLFYILNWVFGSSYEKVIQLRWLSFSLYKNIKKLKGGKVEVTNSWLLQCSNFFSNVKIWLILQSQEVGEIVHDELIHWPAILPLRKLLCTLRTLWHGASHLQVIQYKYMTFSKSNTKKKLVIIIHRSLTYAWLT